MKNQKHHFLDTGGHDCCHLRGADLCICTIFFWRGSGPNLRSTHYTSYIYTGCCAWSAGWMPDWKYPWRRYLTGYYLWKYRNFNRSTLHLQTAQPKAMDCSTSTGYFQHDHRTLRTTFWLWSRITDSTYDVHCRIRRSRIL